MTGWATRAGFRASVELARRNMSLGHILAVALIPATSRPFQPVTSTQGQSAICDTVQSVAEALGVYGASPLIPVTVQPEFPLLSVN